LNLLFLLIILSISFLITEADATIHFPPPLKQVSEGVLPKNVICSEVFSLIIKTADASPACVNYTSVEKLIQRGWGIKILDPSIVQKAQSIWDYSIQRQENEFEGDYIKGPTEDGYEITKYEVVGNTIEKISDPKLPSNLVHLQKDNEKHYEIWNNFINLIPEANRNVSIFYLTTDGIGEIGGGVNRDLEDLSKWYLFYDIYDSYPDGTFDAKVTTHTTIHEFGHILTTSSNQLEVDSELLRMLSNDENKFDDIFAIKSEECFPRYMSVDGCAKTNSYINQFYQRFWTDIISEWDEIQYIESDDKYYEQMTLFYEVYEDRFVSEYASTNVDEDIAESWTAFVLLEKPRDTTFISNQKILFFYEYPELIEMRNHIRNNL
jgi:hypothetical protein